MNKTSHLEIKALKSFIRSIDNELIMRNHEECKYHFDANISQTDVTSCGLTSQAIFNIIMKEQNMKFSNVKVIKTINDVPNLLCNNIIRVGINCCSCCTFPGHAFIIYCFETQCVIIQSFIGEYNHYKYIDIVSKDVIKNYLTNIQKMYQNRKLNIKTLNELTHIDLTKYKKCRLAESNIVVHYMEKILSPMTYCDNIRKSRLYKNIFKAILMIIPFGFMTSYYLYQWRI